MKDFKLKRRIIAFLAGMHLFGNPGAKMKIVGVTGTNGKTTTATLLYRIATALGYKAGLIGTVENLIAGEKVIATGKNPIPGTTPDPITLHRLLRQMVKKDCKYVFMEVSSHALDQGRVAGVTFAGGVFTNLTHDHLDYHKTFENYFEAKKKFFKILSPKAFALANSDDDNGKKMLHGINTNKFSYGFSGGEDFHGEIKKSDWSGLELLFNDTPIKAKLLGKFNAYNLLSVWSASKLLGFDEGMVRKVIETVEPPAGRFQHFTTPSGVLVVVDYAHTPDALEKILNAVKEVKSGKGKIISVFGCGGDRDPLKRSKMGRIGDALSDVPIFTSDNPRSEDPNKIIADMTKELYPEDLKKVKMIADRHEAILEAVKLAQSGDIILCAGKGHEDYQEINGVKNHFDDVEEFKKAYGL